MQAFGRRPIARIKFNGHRRAVGGLHKQRRTRPERTQSAELVVGRHPNAFPDGCPVFRREKQRMEDNDGNQCEERDERNFSRNPPPPIGVAILPLLGSASSHGQPYRVHPCPPQTWHGWTASTCPVRLQRLQGTCPLPPEGRRGPRGAEPDPFAGFPLAAR